MIVTGNKAPRIISFENKIAGTGVFDVDDYVIQQGEKITNGDFATGDFTGWLEAVPCDESVVTGNGFSGNAGRGLLTGGSGAFNPVFTTQSLLTRGHTYKVYGYYRSNVFFTFRDWGGTLIKSFSTNTGDAIYFEYEFINYRSDGQYYFGLVGAGAGNWFEFQAQIIEIPPLPTIKTGTKLLYCATAGTVTFYAQSATRLICDYYDASANTYTHYDDLISNLSFASITDNILTLTASLKDSFFNIYYK